eukprot:CAMPEP_0176499394 /NCGR_PEP_ID=MMETSP0200_2-20121128/12901_1 /TAXON_ID=947934 /ORGANISM="Chaetoceros sp., Strain GSL56" /LENGTH=556 /DNA_ID=CAMNT_0017897805 /DNA_START=195 /DNA_END=1865 /DNA_ORIENTATION=+
MKIILWLIFAATTICLNSKFYHIEAFSLSIRHAAVIKTQECAIRSCLHKTKQRGDFRHFSVSGGRSFSKNNGFDPTTAHFAAASDDMSSSASSSESDITKDARMNVDSQNINERQKESSLMHRTLLRFYSKKFNLDNIIHAASTIPPPVQLLALMSFYILHLTVLTQHSIIFPFQLIPNQQGRFQSIGLDSLAGIISFATIQYIRNRQLKQYNLNPDGEHNITIPSLLSSPLMHDQSSSKKVQQQRQNSTPSPWNFPTYAKFNTLSPRLTSMTSLFLLVSAYFMTGRIANWVELNLYTLAGLGLPLTIAMHRSLVVLGGHLAWVMIGSAILGIILRPQPFFGGGDKQLLLEEEAEGEVSETRVNGDVRVNGDGKHDLGSNAETKSNEKERTVLQKYKWYTNRWNANWLWWTIGGYFISSWFFNIADFLNQMILPGHVFELAGEGVVSQLINPENNDLLASLVGYIAPCISAPWWEEVLYRGFLLPALCLQMKFWPAVFVSGIVFSIHHVSMTGAIPLAILGWTWAAIYAKSGNLFVTIMIHAMWNSRVFLGSWLGL